MLNTNNRKYKIDTIRKTEMNQTNEQMNIKCNADCDTNNIALQCSSYISFYAAKWYK